MEQKARSAPEKMWDAGVVYISGTPNTGNKTHNQFHKQEPLLILDGITSQLQVLDILVNKPFQTTYIAVLLLALGMGPGSDPR